MIVLLDSEYLSIVSPFVWTKHRNVTEGRTDGRTDGRRDGEKWSGYYSGLHRRQRGRAVKIYEWMCTNKD